MSFVRDLSPRIMLLAVLISGACLGFVPAGLNVRQRICWKPLSRIVVSNPVETSPIGLTNQQLPVCPHTGAHAQPATSQEAAVFNIPGVPPIKGTVQRLTPPLPLPPPLSPPQLMPKATTPAMKTTSAKAPTQTPTVANAPTNSPALATPPSRRPFVATNNLFQSPPAAPPPVRGNVPVVPLKPVPIPGGGGGPPNFANVLVRSIVLTAALHAAISLTVPLYVHLCAIRCLRMTAFCCAAVSATV